MTKSGVEAPLLVALVSISVVMGENYDPDGLIKRCRPTGVTDYEIDRMLEGDYNLSYGVKCTLACMVKHYGIVVEDGKFNLEERKKAVKERLTDKKLLEDSLRILDKCAQFQNEDECEMVYKMHICMQEASTKFIEVKDNSLL